MSKRSSLLDEITNSPVSHSSVRGPEALERAAGASRRDEQARLRDIRATLRDRTAALRDESCDDHERAFGSTSNGSSKERATAASERALGAADRDDAANDRKLAALDLEQAAIELEKAELDALTGFYRLGLGKLLMQRELDRSQRSGCHLVLAYCDVDGLKKVNTKEGHAAGDALLVTAAEAIKRRLRSYDIAVRLGGDEFVCMVSEIDLEQARTLFLGVQGFIAASRPGASMSVGLAQLRAEDSLDALLERGDSALRVVKSHSAGQKQPEGTTG